MLIINCLGYNPGRGKGMSITRASKQQTNLHKPDHLIDRCLGHLSKQRWGVKSSQNTQRCRPNRLACPP